jgi:hypothetical protein
MLLADIRENGRTLAELDVTGDYEFFLVNGKNRRQLRLSELEKLYSSPLLSWRSDTHRGAVQKYISDSAQRIVEVPVISVRLPKTEQIDFAFEHAKLPVLDELAIDRLNEAVDDGSIHLPSSKQLIGGLRRVVMFALAAIALVLVLGIGYRYITGSAAGTNAGAAPAGPSGVLSSAGQLFGK